MASGAFSCSWIFPSLEDVLDAERELKAFEAMTMEDQASILQGLTP